LNQSPTPTYNVVSCYVAEGAYCGSTDTDAFDITPEKACGSYNGTLFVNTNSASGGSANVHLQVVVTEEADGSPGDVKAYSTLVFSISDGGSPKTCVGILDAAASTPTQAVYYKDTTITLTSTLCKTLDIEWIINNYYTNGDCPDQETEVTVAAPANDFSAGGGYIILTNNTGGSIAATPGGKNNFGYNVKFNNSLTNLQGNFNTIVRKNVSGVWRVYQVKSNKPTFMKITLIAAATATTPAKRKAEITYSNAVLRDVTDFVNGVCVNPSGCWSEGNGTVYLVVKDIGEPGSTGSAPDSIGFGVKDKNNSLWFSTNTWTNTTTSAAIQALDGGNIQVRQAASGGTVSNQTVNRDITTDQPSAVLPFNVRVFPNPSEHVFTLFLENATNEKVQIVVYDALGRQVKMFEKESGNIPIHFGADLKVGAYVVEVRQGINRKTIKLVKQ